MRGFKLGLTLLLACGCVPQGPREGAWRRGACAVFERAEPGELWPATREELFDCATGASILAVCLGGVGSAAFGREPPFVILKSQTGDFACILQANGLRAYRRAAWEPPPPEPPAPAIPWVPFFVPEEPEPAEEEAPAAEGEESCGC